MESIGQVGTRRATCNDNFSRIVLTLRVSNTELVEVLKENICGHGLRLGLTGDINASAIVGSACHQYRVGLVLSYFFRRVWITVRPVWVVERLRRCNWRVFCFLTMIHQYTSLAGVVDATVWENLEVIGATASDMMESRGILE
jgi:hypothetical protein